MSGSHISRCGISPPVSSRRITQIAQTPGVSGEADPSPFVSSWPEPDLRTPKSAIVSAGGFWPARYSTALRLGHWTGHPTRLNREDGMQARYGSAAYAMEELRAEFSSAFLAAELWHPVRNQRACQLYQQMATCTQIGQEGYLSRGGGCPADRRYGSRIPSRTRGPMC
jgi:Zincin-like metallopeptidase